MTPCFQPKIFHLCYKPYCNLQILILFDSLLQKVDQVKPSTREGPIFCFTSWSYLYRSLDPSTEGDLFVLLPRGYYSAWSFYKRGTYSCFCRVEIILLDPSTREGWVVVLSKGGMLHQIGSYQERSYIDWLTSTLSLYTWDLPSSDSSQVALRALFLVGSYGLTLRVTFAPNL